MGSNSQNHPAWANGDSLKGLYPEGTKWAFDAPRSSLVRLIDWAVDEYRSNIFSDFMGKKMTYGAAGKEIDRAAKGLRQLGVVPGRTVGLHMANTPYYPIMFFAVLKAGGTVVNLSPLDSANEHEKKIADSGADIVVTLNLKMLFDKNKALLDSGKLNNIVICPLQEALDPIKKTAFSIFRHGGTVRHGLNMPGIVPYRKLCDNDGKYKPHQPSGDDVAVLQYTGGTTGIPKGAMLTHFNLVANSSQMEQFYGSSIDKPEHSRALKHGQETIVAALPFFHVFGMTVTMLGSIRLGGQMVILPDPRDVKAVVKVIKRTQATLLPAVPRLLQAVANQKSASASLSSLKSVITGGAALPSGVRNAFEKAVGKPGVIMQGYGLSEASPIVSCNPPHGANRPETVGMPYPGTEIRIAAQEDPSIMKQIGEIGEILVRGPQVMKGYHNHPDETAKVMTEDGWLRTGDLGSLDDKGYLTIADRAKDMVIVNGFKVFPSHVENALSQHPAIAECCVVSVNKGEVDESAKAFIRLKPSEAILEKDLRAYLKDHLSTYEIPRFFEYRTEELPKTTIGKPDRKALQAGEALKSKPLAPPAPQL